MGRTGRSDLRSVLKRETASMHDTLDGTMGEEAIASPRDYARFLMAQHRARKPIEEWVERNLPAHAAPPAQAPLIEADLAALGQTIPVRHHGFSLPENADPIGLQWALAGSSLGNRAMLAQRRKLGLDGPEAFLSDGAMPAFFKKLRPELEVEADPARARRAVLAAEAVFACFLDALEPVAETA